MESGAKGRARGRRKGSNPSLPLLSPSLLQFRLSSLCQAEIRSCGFTAPGLECASGTFSTPPPSLPPTPGPGRDAEVGSHKSERGSRPRAAGCQIAASILSKTEHGLKYRASIHSTAAIQNGRGGEEVLSPERKRRKRRHIARN